MITEHGNLLLDIRFEKAIDPAVMELEINRVPGVVENGIFAFSLDENLSPVVFIGRPDGNVEQRLARKVK